MYNGNDAMFSMFGLACAQLSYDCNHVYDKMISLNNEYICLNIAYIGCFVLVEFVRFNMGFQITSI